MPVPVPTRMMLCLLAVLLPMAGASAQSAPASAAPSVDESLDRYAKPAKWVSVSAQRRLNVRCEGRGTPTIILESGALADSMTWSGIQPALAELTRVCAYDRAGLGFSDGGPLPRDVDAAVTDLRALTVALKLRGQVILVGHSLGSNIVRRYAERFPRQVAALVLLDPPEHQVGAFSAAWEAGERNARANALAFISRCTLAAEQDALDPPAAELAQCLRGPDPRYSERLNEAIRRNKLRPAFWYTLGSTMQENGVLFEQAISADANLGNLPVYLLSTANPYAQAEPADRAVLEAAHQRTHEQIAALSTQTRRISVAQASHDLHVDQPEIVIAAITEALEQARAAASRRP
jgi:pimeloyl-ACP methyl ester carboxylesterase